MSLLQGPLKRADTDHDCPTHDTWRCHTRHARLYNMFPLQAGSSKRGWMGGGLSPLLTSRGNVLTGTSVIFGCHRVDIRVTHAWRGCLRAHPNKKSATCLQQRPVCGALCSLINFSLKLILKTRRLFLRSVFVGLFLVLKVA